MSQRCSQPHCFAPEVACHLGEANHRDCVVWRGSTSDPATPNVGSESPQTLFPWSGNSFGPVDAAFVTGRSTPTVVAIVGPHNAGKTTLLAAWFILLGRGRRFQEGVRFAGSYTLEGWENAAHALRWAGNGGPTFPPHTSSGGGRNPGLLHLALRGEDGKLRDFLFADAPGEWFRRWATNRDAPDAAGARWVAEHADVFVLVADCDSLAGSERGAARNLLKLLAQRLGAERMNRPAALVWSKADIAVPTAIQDAIRTDAMRLMDPIPEFSVSVLSTRETGEGNTVGSEPDFLELLKWVASARQPNFQLPRRTSPGADPFLAFEGV